MQEDARNPDLHIHVDKPATESMLLPVMVKAVTKAVEKTLAKTARPKAPPDLPRGELWPFAKTACCGSPTHSLMVQQAKAKAATWAPLAWAKPDVTVAPVVELEEQVSQALARRAAPRRAALRRTRCAGREGCGEEACGRDVDAVTSRRRRLVSVARWRGARHAARRHGRACARLARPA